jgi:glycosyltransferase involved in cell wall biosynthesis
MKILHVNNNFRFLGGSEQYLYGVCSELKNLGHTNVLIHGDSESSSHTNVADKKYCVSFLDDFDNRRYGILRTEIHGIIGTEMPDVIYLHNIHNPYVVSILSELAPVVKFVHDHEFYCPKGIRILNDNLCCNARSLVCFMNALRGNGFRCMGRRSQIAIIAKKTKQLVLNKRIHRKVDTFIVASHHMKQNLISLGFEGDIIKVIPYFTEIRENVTELAGDRNILYAGRISPEKGIDIFIDVLSTVNVDFRFVIVGEGNQEYVTYIREKVREYNLSDRVDFVGWIDNEDLDDYYAKSAFLVVPSIWPEPFGIVGIEAMAHSRPVLAFDVGGIPEWLDNGKTGFLIERGNKTDFARRIELLLKDESLRGELGQNAYKRSSALYNKANHIEKLLSIFHDVVRKK